MSWEQTKLEISDAVRQLMEERHVSEDEVKQVVFYAEQDGDKLYQPDANRYLAKRAIGNATFYVEYSVEDGEYAVRSVYAHKADVKE